MSTHNKKRNSALLYEFLVRAISAAIIDDDKRRSSVALKILKKHYKPGSELYKEYRLVHALVTTTVSSELTAASIISEAKRAAREHDVTALDREKSLLIKDINCTLCDEEFYDRHINEYRELATAQQLLNCWRMPVHRVDIATCARLEEGLLKSLTAPAMPRDHMSDVIDEGPGMNRLVMKLMMKKMNERYSGALLPEQKDLLKSYAFSAIKGNNVNVSRKLDELRTGVLEAIDRHLKGCNDSEYFREKLTQARVALLSEDVSSVDDALVTRFMLYVKLRSEIDSDEETT